MSEIARDIAQYLQDNAIGTLHETIFIDSEPSDPDTVVVIFDAGGVPPAGILPDDWRSLQLQVRSSDHATAYSKVWQALDYIIRPASGFVEVSLKKILTTLTDLPFIAERDQQNRYIYAFNFTAQIVPDVAAAIDLWLTALSNWSSTLLGAGWHIYLTQFPLSFERPCLLWRITGTDTQDEGASMYRLQKKIAGHVLGRTPDEQTNCITTIIQGFGDATKIVLDAADRRYLTVDDPTANANNDAFLMGQVAVTLKRSISRTQAPGTAVGTVTVEPNIL